MEDRCIQKDILYGEHASGKRSVGRPHLHYKDVCKCDLIALDINIESWEDIAAMLQYALFSKEICQPTSPPKKEK